MRNHSDQCILHVCIFQNPHWRITLLLPPRRKDYYPFLSNLSILLCIDCHHFILCPPSILMWMLSQKWSIQYIPICYDAQSKCRIQPTKVSSIVSRATHQFRGKRQWWGAYILFFLWSSLTLWFNNQSSLSRNPKKIVGKHLTKLLAIIYSFSLNILSAMPREYYEEALSLSRLYYWSVQGMVCLWRP